MSPGGNYTLQKVKVNFKKESKSEHLNVMMSPHKQTSGPHKELPWGNFTFQKVKVNFKKLKL